MNNDDLNKFRKVVREEVSQVVDESVSASEKRLVGTIDEKISASEKRLDQKIDQRITVSEEKIINAVSKFISEDVLTQLDEKADKADIERLERKIDRCLDMNVDHESRIKDIEQISVIAHQLGSKRSK